MSWEVSGDKTHYGSEFESVVNLTGHDAKPVLAIKSTETDGKPAMAIICASAAAT